MGDWRRRHSSSTTYGKFTPKRYDCIWATDQCIRYFSDKKEMEIVKAAQRHRSYIIASCAILAWRDKVTVPKEYRISLLRAVISLRKLTSDDYFEYYLAQIHPKLALFHEYYKKIKQILHLA